VSCQQLYENNLNKIMHCKINKMQGITVLINSMMILYLINVFMTKIITQKICLKNNFTKFDIFAFLCYEIWKFNKSCLV